MRYLRKINCLSLKIKVIFEDQSYVLRLFTKLKNLGYHDAEILDYKTDDSDAVNLNDNQFEKILKKIK
jgi:hypothetical protein